MKENPSPTFLNVDFGTFLLLELILLKKKGGKVPSEFQRAGPTQRTMLKQAAPSLFRQDCTQSDEPFVRLEIGKPLFASIYLV